MKNAFKVITRKPIFLICCVANQYQIYLLRIVNWVVYQPFATFSSPIRVCKHQSERNTLWNFSFDTCIDGLLFIWRQTADETSCFLYISSSIAWCFKDSARIQKNIKPLQMILINKFSPYCVLFVKQECYFHQLKVDY